MISYESKERKRNKMFERIARICLKYCFEKDKIEITDGWLKQAAIHSAPVIKERFDRPVLPHPGETVAIAPDTPKTAALFFDRIWYPFISDIFPEIAIYGATDFEIWSYAIMLSLSVGKPDNYKFELNEIEEIRTYLSKISKKTPLYRFFGSGLPIARIIAEELFEYHGLLATPIYESIESLSREYRPGKTEVIFAAVKDIGIVNEAKLDWSQVEEFRKDSNARKKYRRMVHWLDSEMVGKPAAFVGDAISNKLEDYDWALKKHGIETVVGCFERILDPRFIGASSAAMVGLTLAGDQFLAAIGGLGLLAGKTAISITKTTLDIIDRKRGKDSEVAFVYDMKKKLK